MSVDGHFHGVADRPAPPLAQQLSISRIQPRHACSVRLCVSCWYIHTGGLLARFALMRAWVRAADHVDRAIWQERQA
jgi:hypothetical protein